MTAEAATTSRAWLRNACLWCGREFVPRDRGAPQRFCEAGCRDAYHTALRRWGDDAVRSGRLSVAELRGEAAKPEHPRVVVTLPDPAGPVRLVVYDGNTALADVEIPPMVALERAHDITDAALRALRAS